MIPKFYFINLEFHKDRLDHMEKFFSKLERKSKLQVQRKRINALNGNEIKENSSISKYCNKSFEDLHDRGKKASPGEFGCTYSHLKAMNEFINDSSYNYDYAFICEDDIDLFKIDINFFMAILGKVIENISKNEIISLSCVGSPIIIGKISEDIQSPVFVDYNTNKGGFYGTGCYMITRNLAKKILSNFWKNNKFILPDKFDTMVADHFIYAQSLKTSFMIPSLFTIKVDNDSFIHHDHVFMHDNVQRIMFEVWKKFNIAKQKKVSIISNNEWGKNYFVNNNIDFNTPTIGTYFTPEDYILFLENFDECINTPLVRKEKSNTCYPVGVINLEKKDTKISVHFIQERDWEISLKNWEERKNKLPNKSEILFKFCDREFKGKFTEDLINRFIKIDLPKKVIFVSEYFDYKNKDLIKNKIIRTIPIKLSDPDKKSSPNGNKLYQICGTS